MSLSLQSDATTTLADIEPYMAEGEEYDYDDVESAIFLEINTYEEAVHHSYEAVELQTNGNFREAKEKYRSLIKAIDTLLLRENDLTQEEFNLITSLRNQSTDTVLAINYQMNQMLPREGGRGGGRATDDQLLRDYQMMLVSTRFNLLFHSVAMPLAISVIVLTYLSTGRCTSVLILVACYLYIPIGTYTLVLAVLLRKRLSELKYDYRRFNRDDRTAHQPNTLGYYLEIYDQSVSVLKFIWYCYAVTTLFLERELDCVTGAEVDTIYDLYVALLVFSSLEYWLVALGLACIPILICLGCVLFYRLYREHKKTRPVGMHEEALQRIESKSFHEGMFAKDYDTCAICLCEFDEEDEQRIRVLPCSGKHVFHKKCIDTWLLKNDTCPQCREHLLGHVKRLQQQQNEV